MSGIEDFSGFEVIRAAMEVEKQGHQFYSEVARLAKSDLAKEVFSWLAQDEVKHLSTLEKLVPRYQEGAFWEDEEVFLPYLRRFADARIFPSPEAVEAVLDCEKGDLKALNLAIEAEEKFAEYFEHAAAQARSDEGKQAFAWLAKEEWGHAKVLKDRRERLAKMLDGK